MRTREDSRSRGDESAAPRVSTAHRERDRRCTLGGILACARKGTLRCNRRRRMGTRALLLLLGSETTKVLTHSKLPVLVR